MRVRFETEGFNLGEVLDEVERVGAASVQLLPKDTRQVLLQEAQLVFLNGWVGKKGHEAALIHSPTRRLREYLSEFHQLLDDQLERLNPYPFSTRLQLKPLLIKYHEGSPGLLPHKDFEEINLFCNLVIEGRGKFFVCSDQSGRDPVEIDDSPGRAVFMRAPGFRGVTEPQYHFVSDIQDERYILSLRQNGRIS